MPYLLAMTDRPPRFSGALPWERHLKIGLLIDWLDSRPEHAVHDRKALRRMGKRRDMVALAAAVITCQLDYDWLELDGPVDHALEYRAFYHDQIAGHLQEDELPIGDEVYGRLHAVDPNCLSGLVNLAELERRRGDASRAYTLLQTALERANTAPGERRYNIANRAWLPEIRCALARLECDPGEGKVLLEHARRESLPTLVTQMRDYPSQELATIAAHRAFGAASAEQRIILHAAMDLASLEILRLRRLHTPASAPYVPWRSWCGVNRRREPRTGTDSTFAISPRAVAATRVLGPMPTMSLALRVSSTTSAGANSMVSSSSMRNLLHCCQVPQLASTQTPYPA